MEDFRILGKEGDVINYEKFKIGAVNVSELEQKKIAIAEARARCLQIIDEQNAELEKLELAQKELEFEISVVNKYNSENSENENISNENIENESIEEQIENENIENESQDNLDNIQ